MVTYTAVFEYTGERWIAYLAELPGANTQGRTIEEARENLHEATRMILEVNREIERRHSPAHRDR
jgi:predicted RNase H-like HicB family nuclease